MSVILITGNPVDGFKYIGPFDTPDSAISYEEHILDEGGDWWITPLVTPESESKPHTHVHRITGEEVTVTGRINGITIFDSDIEDGEELLDELFFQRYVPVWQPTHVSKKDGSTARYTGFGEPPTDGYILLANENGDEWMDAVSDWEPVS